MKKLILVMVAVTLAAFAVGAQQITLGFVAANQGAVTQATVSNRLEQIAKTEGWKIFISNAAGSWEKMNNLVENYVSRKVDAIIIAMGQASSMQTSLQAAKNAGIPVFAIDNEYSELMTADVLTNNWEMGSKIATYLCDRLNHKGNILVFKFDQFYGTRFRGKALDTVLSEEPNIKVLDTHYLPPAGFVEDAQAAMQAYLVKYGKQINAVWCAWDDPAYGVSLAIKDKGFTQKDIFVVGIDGNPRNLQLIKSGQSPIAATILQPFEDSTAKVADLIKQIVVKKRSPQEVIGDVKVIYMSTPLVTSANAGDYLK
jgi:ribose transport system substrate-binding protein